MWWKAVIPCHFSPLAEIPDSLELLENFPTDEGVQSGEKMYSG